MKKAFLILAALLCCCFAMKAQSNTYEPIMSIPSPINSDAVYYLGYQDGQDFYLHTSGTTVGQMHLSKNPENPVEYKFQSMKIGESTIFVAHSGETNDTYLSINAQGVSYGTFNPMSSTATFSLSIVNGDISSAAASGYTVCHDENNIITTHTGTSEGNLRFFVTTSKPSYTVNVSATPEGLGTATATCGGETVESALEGTSITVTATPAANCIFTGWTENGVQVSTDNPYTFTLTSDRNLVANFTFVNTYATVSYTQSTGGTFSVSPTTNVMESQRVNIEITRTDPHFSFDDANYESKISVTDASGNPVIVNKQSDGHYYFSMPNSNATVSVTFDEDPKNDIDVIQPDEGCTISVNPFTNVYYLQNVQLTYELVDGFYFVEWVVKDGKTPIQVYNGCFTMPNSPNVTVTATVELLEPHIVSIDDDIVGGHISTGGVSTAYANETVHLSSYPAPGYEFFSWTVTAECGTIEINNNSFIMPNCDVTVSATFLPAITVYAGTNTNQNTAVFTYFGDTSIL